MFTLFETEHLRARKFVMDDSRTLYENHLDAQFQKWFPNESYADLEEAQDAIRFYADCVINNRLPYVLAVELKETGELIGDTGISPVTGSQSEVEIGYGIYNSHRRKGYATELLGAMTEFVRSHFGVSVLSGRVLHGNHASIRVLEKNGYAFVREELGAEDDPYGCGMRVYQKTY